MEIFKVVLLIVFLYMTFTTIQYTINAMMNGLTSDSSNIALRTLSSSILRDCSTTLIKVCKPVKNLTTGITKGKSGSEEVPVNLKSCSNVYRLLW